jgi:Family of unknown function (DUF6677)
MTQSENHAQGDARVPRGTAAQAALMFVAGWFVPGLGHLLQRRWGRAAAFFIAVGGLAVTGYVQRGFVFHSGSANLFDTLGFLADIGSGAFYFAAKWLEVTGPDISRAAGDYGTRFLVTAGVLNVLCAIDAYETCRWGRE